MSERVARSLAVILGAATVAFAIWGSVDLILNPAPVHPPGDVRYDVFAR